MTVRQHAVRILILALPLCAAVAASTAVAEVTVPPAAPNAPAERPLSANPLWAMPLKQFSETRERPIFSPSRRPPLPPPSAVTVAKVVVPKPKEPEQPQLSLVGTIASDEDRLGIFVDQATKNVLRLRVGEDFQGWTLKSVQGRETTFQKNQLNFVVALPQPGLGQPSVSVRSEAPPVTADAGRPQAVNVRQQRQDRQ